jgi:hypothetical protein
MLMPLLVRPIDSEIDVADGMVSQAENTFQDVLGVAE